MRGTDSAARFNGLFDRFIPAHAGETWRPIASNNDQKVHPPACGGSMIFSPGDDEVDPEARVVCSLLDDFGS